MQTRSEVFAQRCKQTNRQTNRQTYNDDYITSLAEAIIVTRSQLNHYLRNDYLEAYAPIKIEKGSIAHSTVRHFTKSAMVSVEVEVSKMGVTAMFFVELRGIINGEHFQLSQ